MRIFAPLALLIATPGFALQATDSEGAPEPQLTWFEAPQTASIPQQAIQGLSPATAFLSLNQDPEGDMPRDAAFTPDGNRVFVVNRDTDTVTVFDFATRTILETIGVGDFPVDVEIAPNGSVAAVPNLLSDTVSLIDVATLTVTATVPVTHLTASGQPYRVAFDAASTVCVVSVIDGGQTSRFSVLDLGSQSEVLSFPSTPHGAVGFFGTPESAIFGNVFSDWELAADGSFLLVPDRGNDTLSAYNVSTGAQLASLAIGDVPAYVDLSADGTRGVVSLAGTLDAVVDLSISSGVPSISSTTPTNLSAFDPVVRLTPDTNFAIVAVQNAVEFIDLNAGSSVTTVSTGTVGDIEFTFDDEFAVITNFNTRIIRLSTRSLVNTLTFAATADAAVSPVSHRLVGLNNRFAEDLHYYSTDGSNGDFLGRTLSGEEPEVDAPRRVEVIPNTTRALVAGLTSRSVVEFDVLTGQTLNVYPAGDRVWEIATDAAGTVAVVTSTESDQVQILDLNAGTVVATLSVPTRPTQVAVSDDGTRAYVTTVAGSDRVWFLDLAGAASSVSGSILSGQLGSVLFNYNQSSGLALSPDGQTAAICVSFDDELLLVDTATQSEITRVPVGDFPLRATWSGDGSTIYVSCPFGDAVHRVNFAGSASANTGNTPAVDDAFQLTLGGADQFLYVGEYGFGTDRLAIIDTASMQRVASIDLPGRPHSQERFGNALLVGADDMVLRIELAGAASSLVENISVSGNASDLAFASLAGTVITTQPGADDGVDLTTFGGAPIYECTGEPNSLGSPAEIDASGTFLAGGFPLTVSASNLPTNQFGLLLTSQMPGDVFPVANSQGRLCLSGSIGRFTSLAASSGAAGFLAIDVDTNSVPNGPGSTAIQQGETWYFQFWYRDVNPSTTSNFTNRVGIVFE